MLQLLKQKTKRCFAVYLAL